MMKKRKTALSRDVKTRIDVEMHKRVIERAEREHRSESAIVREALRQFLADPDETVA